MLEKEGLNAQVVTTWKCQTLVKYYGIQMPYYLIEEHEMQLRLKSGRILSFILTPYLHFAGAFVTYDMKTRSLFSVTYLELSVITRPCMLMTIYG